MNDNIRSLPATTPATNSPLSWLDLSEELPAWLPKVTLADSCLSEVLVVAAASAGIGLTAGAAPALLARMDAAGLFLEPAVDGDPCVRVLRPDVREAMMTEIESTEPGVPVVREELLAAGLTQPAGRLGAQLATWALDSGDWAGLQAVWLGHSTADLVVDPRVRAGVASVPTEVRATLPGLSFAAALSSAYEPVAGHVDLDRMISVLVRDGRTLHADWQHKESAEAQVLGGTLWMLAQASIPESVDDPQLAGPARTHDEIGRVIRDASLSGSPLSAQTLTLFYAIASLAAILRADFSRARRDGELAMMLSDKCFFAGFVATLAVASASAVSGSAQYAAVADTFLAQHAAHGCPLGDWIEPAFHLVRAETAIRQLDRELAAHHLRLHLTEGGPTRWFNVQPMHAMVLGTAAILWDDPGLGLAQFDSVVADSGHELDHRNPWGPLLLRSRSELLLSVGAVQRAERIILDLLANADGSVSAVPAALFYLCAGDFAKALAKAEEGIYQLKISLTDRAHLYVVRSAALQQAGAAEELVGIAATAACVVCEQAGTLVPFAALPSGVRSYLLAAHDQHHRGTDCFVTLAMRRGAFDNLPDSFDAPRTIIRLTPREAALLPLLATPATVQEIANQQYVSVNTLRKQVVSLRKKLGASRRSDLIRRADQLGLLAERRAPDPNR